MFQQRREMGVLGIVGITALVLTLGVGTYVAVAEGRRRSRLRRSVIGRARRVLTRNMAHATRRVRSRVDHFSV